MWGLDIAAQVRILFGADLFQIFVCLLYRQHIICALTPHVLTSLHIVLGTQGQVHALDTSGAYLGKPCLYIQSFSNQLFDGSEQF